MQTIKLNNGKVVLTKEQATQELKILVGSLSMSLNDHYQWEQIVDFISKPETMRGDSHDEVSTDLREAYPGRSNEI